MLKCGAVFVPIDLMIPSHIYQATKIPLNRNGKVDITGLDKYIIERKKKKSVPKNEIECFVLNVHYFTTL